MGFWGYLLAALVVLAYCAWFGVMLNSRHFREVSNEVWAHYWINAFKYIWPLALIFAVYRVIEDGTLAATVGAAFR